MRRPASLFLVLMLAGCARAPESARPAFSESVKVDQVGYLPARPKLAIVIAAPATGAFAVRRSADGTEALRGTLGPQISDPDTGDTVRIADLSVLRDSGSYYLDVAGVGASHEFDVAPNVYSSVFTLAMRAFYGQRCGTAVELAPTFSGYRHPACHVAGAANPDALMHASSGASDAVDGSQGWHDAGDYGKYVVNSGITTGELIWTYETFADRVGAVRLDIPESGNPVPDILDEVRWNLEWMLKMQDGDGGVWPKLTSERFGGFVMPHLDDGGPRYVIGTGSAPFKSSCATGDFAAVMAAASRVFRPFDPDFARLTLAAAERAWRWLSEHPNVVFRNCCGVQTGEYGDGNCADERLWAAAELFRTTGAAEYNPTSSRTTPPRGRPSSPEARRRWPQVGSLALVTYYFAGQPVADEAVRAQVRADTLGAACRGSRRSATGPSGALIIGRAARTPTPSHGLPFSRADRTATGAIP